MQSNGTPMPAAAPGTAIVASSGSLGPAAAAPAVDSTAAVAYGASSFHVDMAASPGVNTNASGLVMFFLNPMESRCLFATACCASEDMLCVHTVFLCEGLATLNTKACCEGF